MEHRWSSQENWHNYCNGFTPPVYALGAEPAVLGSRYER